MSWFNNPRNCSKCGRFMDQEFLDEKRKSKAFKIRESFAKTISEGSRENGFDVGRTRKIDYKEVWLLRQQGWSINKLAEKFNCSRGSIQHSLKLYLEELCHSKNS